MPESRGKSWREILDVHLASGQPEIVHLRNGGLRIGSNSDDQAEPQRLLLLGEHVRTEAGRHDARRRLEEFAAVECRAHGRGIPTLTTPCAGAGALKWAGDRPRSA